MSKTDYLYALLAENKLDLMYLPSGCVAWLLDRPDAQIKASAALGMAAKDINPISDGSLLRSDQNVLILTCEGGQKFRIYPDGGTSFDGQPTDFDGCVEAMNNVPDHEGGYDDCGPACGCDSCQADHEPTEPTCGSSHEELPAGFENMAVSMESYSDDEMEEVERAMGTYEFNNEASGDTGLRNLIGKSSNLFGSLKHDIKDRIFRYFKQPNNENWNDIYSIIISEKGFKTLWQAWAAIDPSAPKSKSENEEWPNIPDVFMLKKAIEVALTESMDVKFPCTPDEELLSYDQLVRKLGYFLKR